MYTKPVQFTLRGNIAFSNQMEPKHNIIIFRTDLFTPDHIYHASQVSYLFTF